MAVTKGLARDVVNFQVQIASTWTHIGGVESVAHAPAKTTSDSTDWDSNGRAEHIVAQRSETWTLAGFFLEDASTGARDPGQEALLNAGRQVGVVAGLINVRANFQGGGTMTFAASVDWTGPSGGKNDVAKFQAVLEMSGAPTFTGVS